MFRANINEITSSDQSVASDMKRKDYKKTALLNSNFSCKKLFLGEADKCLASNCA